MAAESESYLIGTRNKQPVSKNGSVQKWVFVILAVGPCFIGYLLFNLYPNLLSIQYSFLQWNGISEPKFVGLDNFKYMLEDKYIWSALYHNLILICTVPALTVLISLFLAYLLNYKGYRESQLYKVLFFLPNVLAVVVVALLWSFIYDGNFGMLNAVLDQLGIDMNNFYWLGHTDTALWALLPPLIWSSVGFHVIIFMNAMKGIPSSLYEAAVLEGAGHMTKLFKITIPLIAPIIRVGVLFLVIGMIKGFEFILILTKGGPSGSTEVIGLYMFNMAFGAGARNYGYASAIGMLLFVILVAAKLVIDRYSSSDRVEY